MANETPSLAQTLQDAIDKKLVEVHTAMPGSIVSYNSALQTATIQPNLKRKFADGSIEDLPLINNVPILWPRTRTTWVHFPLVKDDQVTLFFMERSVDTWKTSGGQTNPDDVRRHALTDAFAYPGGYPISQPMVLTEPNALQLAHGVARVNVQDTGETAIKAGPGMTMKVTPTGKISFKNEVSTAELLDKLITWVDNIASNTTVATGIGIQPLIKPPTYTVDKAAVDTFKE